MVCSSFGLILSSMEKLNPMSHNGIKIIYRYWKIINSPLFCGLFSQVFWGCVFLKREGIHRNEDYPNKCAVTLYNPFTYKHGKIQYAFCCVPKIKFRSLTFKFANREQHRLVITKNILCKDEPKHYDQRQVHIRSG